MFWMIVNKLFIYLAFANLKTKRSFIVKYSTYSFHMKTKVLTEFHICISVPLSFWLWHLICACGCYGVLLKEKGYLEGLYMKFHFKRNELFSVRCLVNLSKLLTWNTLNWNSSRVLFQCGHSDRMRFYFEW